MEAVFIRARFAEVCAEEVCYASGNQAGKKSSIHLQSRCCSLLVLDWRNVFKGEASVQCLTDSIARGPGRRRQLRAVRAAWTVPGLQRLRLSRRRKMEDTKDMEDLRVFPPHLGGTGGDRWDRWRLEEHLLKVKSFGVCIGVS